MKPPRVSVIIINWNGLEWLEVCLPSLAKVTYPNLEVIVVDNGSTDGSVEYLNSSLLHPEGEDRRSHPPGDPGTRRPPHIVTTIVKNSTNLGFAYPNNQGIDRATGEFVLFLNNDMTYDPGFIEPLVAACQRPGVGAAQPKMVRLNNPARLDGVGSYLTIYGVLLHYGFGRDANAKQYNVERDVFCPKGAAMMVRADVLKQTRVISSNARNPDGISRPGPRNDSQGNRPMIERFDYFDADYFAYFEETDLAWRIWLAGYHIRYVPSALVQHAGGETAKRISTFAHEHSFKNRIATLIKNLGFGTLLWLLPLHLALVTLVSFAYLTTGQFHVFAATWRAVWWNLMNLRSTLRKRHRVQATIRKVSDRDLFPKIMRPLPLNYFKYLFGANLEEWPEPDSL